MQALTLENISEQLYSELERRAHAENQSIAHIAHTIIEHAVAASDGMTVDEWRSRPPEVLDEINSHEYVPDLEPVNAAEVVREIENE